jgi:hypothetical protein
LNENYLSNPISSRTVSRCVRNPLDPLYRFWDILAEKWLRLYVSLPLTYDFNLWPAWQAHVSKADATPLLIFPEGTCVNNEYTLLFKWEENVDWNSVRIALVKYMVFTSSVKCLINPSTIRRGAFDMDCTVCPIAIKYNKIFVDGFWNSWVLFCFLFPVLGLFEALITGSCFITYIHSTIPVYLLPCCHASASASRLVGTCARSCARGRSCVTCGSLSRKQRGRRRPRASLRYGFSAWSRTRLSSRLCNGERCWRRSIASYKPREEEIII